MAREMPIPADYEGFGRVPDRTVALVDVTRGRVDLATIEVADHVCRVTDGRPLCGAAVPDDAPVTPFRGRRRAIRASVADCCDVCRALVAAIARSERAVIERAVDVPARARSSMDRAPVFRAGLDLGAAGVVIPDAPAVTGSRAGSNPVAPVDRSDDISTEE